VWVWVGGYVWVWVWVCGGGGGTGNWSVAQYQPSLFCSTPLSSLLYNRLLLLHTSLLSDAHLQQVN
jgi:hypothetical protein